jgi:hypothetical protein
LYRLLVNQSELQFDFGRLMGCYIAAFFLVSHFWQALFSMTQHRGGQCSVEHSSS